MTKEIGIKNKGEAVEYVDTTALEGNSGAVANALLESLVFGTPPEDADISERPVVDLTRTPDARPTIVLTARVHVSPNRQPLLDHILGLLNGTEQA